MAAPIEAAVRYDVAEAASSFYRDVIAGLTARRSEEHTSELQSQSNLVCRLLLEKKNTNNSRAVAPRPSPLHCSYRQPVQRPRARDAVPDSLGLGHHYHPVPYYGNL